MITIVADGDKAAAELIKDDLRRFGLPCAVADRFVDDLMILITFSEKCSYNIDAEKVLFADKVALMNSEMRQTELERIRLRISDLLFVKYGLIAGAIEAGPLCIASEHVKYLGKPIHLTSAEKRIAIFLAMNKGKRLTADEIAEYCLADDTSQNAVSVHVNNINRKSLLCSPVRMISACRFSGYKLNIK